MKIQMFLLFSICLIICSCSRTYYPPELYEDIKVGQSRKQVEEIIGKSAFPDTTNSRLTDVWYLNPPIIKTTDSPYAPGAIGITYDNKNIVLKKQLNSQGKYRRQKIKR